jgi:type I restriction enzyme R subunit
LSTLKIARQLAIWFHKSFGKQQEFSAGPFVPPPEPADATAPLQDELDRLKAELAKTLSAQERARQEALEAQRARESAEERARREAEERLTWEQLAQEAEEAKLAIAAELLGLQAEAVQATPAERATVIIQAEKAAEGISLDEAATRTIIDQQLRDRGWEVDSEKLRYAQGARPARGRAMAIAEWPTESGPADYN